MVQHALHLTIMLILWIPLLPFLIFASSSPQSVSLTYVPSASCPPWHRCVIMGSSSNLADHLHFWQDHFLHFQHIFIFITVIAAHVDGSYHILHYIMDLKESAVPMDYGCWSMFSMIKPQKNKIKSVAIAGNSNFTFHAWSCGYQEKGIIWCHSHSRSISALPSFSNNLRCLWEPPHTPALSDRRPETFEKGWADAKERTNRLEPIRTIRLPIFTEDICLAPVQGKNLLSLTRKR